MPYTLALNYGGVQPANMILRTLDSQDFSISETERELGREPWHSREVWHFSFFFFRVDQLSARDPYKATSHQGRNFQSLNDYNILIQQNEYMTPHSTSRYVSERDFLGITFLMTIFIVISIIVIVVIIAVVYIFGRLSIFYIHSSL